MVNDALPNRILSGTVVLKGDIREFTEDGILFEDEDEVVKCDAVILATGYEVCFPFLDHSILWTENNHVELYKYMFPPKLKHPHTLAAIGLIQAVGPAIPISEQQSRWFVQLMKGELNCIYSFDELFFSKRDDVFVLKVSSTIMQIKD